MTFLRLRWSLPMVLVFIMSIGLAAAACEDEGEGDPFDDPGMNDDGLDSNDGNDGF